MLSVSYVRGRSSNGERLICDAPRGHWRRTTMIFSVRVAGTTACMIIEEPTYTEVFNA
jgi:hypothetical protein